VFPKCLIDRLLAFSLPLTTRIGVGSPPRNFPLKMFGSEIKIEIHVPTTREECDWWWSPPHILFLSFDFYDYYYFFPPSAPSGRVAHIFWSFLFCSVWNGARDFRVRLCVFVMSDAPSPCSWSTRLGCPCCLAGHDENGVRFPFSSRNAGYRPAYSVQRRCVTLMPLSKYSSMDRRSGRVYFYFFGWKGLLSLLDL